MRSHRNEEMEIMRWQHQAPAADPSRAKLTNRLIDEHEAAYMARPKGCQPSLLALVRGEAVKVEEQPEKEAGAA